MTRKSHKLAIIKFQTITDSIGSSDESTGEQVFVTLGGWWKPTSDAKWRYENMRNLI